MVSRGLLVRIEAKQGKEEEVMDLLARSLYMACQEATTPLWFTLRLGVSTFAVFDAFADDAARQSHLGGPIAKALMANSDELFAMPPVIERVDIPGYKLSMESLNSHSELFDYDDAG